MGDAVDLWELERHGRLKLAADGKTPIREPQLTSRGEPVSETSHEYVMRKPDAR